VGQGLKGHVLIIEDEMLIAMDLEHLLEGLGFDSFDIADSPTQAFAHAMAHRPDLITADVQIIDGTGIEATRAIVASLGPIPVIFVTGNLDMLRDLDAPAVVEKPINAGAFATVCQRLCA
jgi:CheY-like chemotaxis protein